MGTIVRAAIAEFNRQGLVQRAIKPLVIALFVVGGFAAAPSTASATTYDCTLHAFGVLSYGPSTTPFTEFSDLAAIQSCQNDVNNLAFALCDGQGTVAPFYIYYAIRRYPGAVKIGEEYIAWQCIDGQPSYWEGEGQL